MRERRGFDFSDISPVCLIRSLLRGLWMIAAAALTAAMLASLAVGYFHHPEYRASMTYVVTTKRSALYPGTSITAAKEVGSILSELLDNDILLNRIREHSERLSGFEGVITAEVVGGSNFIVLNATASAPEDAFLSLKALNAIFPSLGDFLSSNSVVQLIRNPTVSASPVNRIDTAGITRPAAFGGAALTALVICLISVRRETIQTRDGAHRLLDAPILGVIRHEKKNRTLKDRIHRTVRGLQVFSPTTGFAYTEQINALCAEIEREAAENGRKIFLIAGVGENEGKSTLAGNIAAALAMRGGKTAIVDADLRKPSLHLFFDRRYNASLPLNRFLTQPFSEENLRRCIRLHERLGLYMLLPTESDPRSTELISGETMTQLLTKLRSLDYVILDSPPMGICPDAEALAELADASLLVVRQDYTPACDINDAADVLRGANAAFLGCVLNGMRDIDDYLSGGYTYKKKYGGYGYGTRAKN